MRSVCGDEWSVCGGDEWSVESVRVGGRREGVYGHPVRVIC